MKNSHEEVTGVEISGFVWWITSAVAYVLYLVWAFVPSSILIRYGITYYPSKYWAVAVPTWICVTTLFICWMYEILNGIHAANLSEREAHLSYGSEKDRFFSSPEELNDRVMPLVEIPPQVIDDIIHENRRPHDAEALYRRKAGRNPRSEEHSLSSF